MATIAGVDCADGVLLAGDRRVVSDGAVAGERRLVFDLDGVVAAATGGDVDEFRRRLEAEVREYRTSRGGPTVDTLARLATEAVDGTDVEAIVAGRDEDGRAALRTLAEGAVLEDDVVASGSGAQVVLGRLEGAGGASIADAEPRVREAFSAAAERDPGTGSGLDVVRLDDAGGEDRA